MEEEVRAKSSPYRIMAISDDKTPSYPEATAASSSSVVRLRLYTPVADRFGLHQGARQPSLPIYRIPPNEVVHNHYL